MFCALDTAEELSLKWTSLVLAGHCSTATDAAVGAKPAAVPVYVDSGDSGLVAGACGPR